jgi:TPR repeat protein
VDATAKPKAKPVAPAKIALANKRAAKREPSVTSAKASKLPAPAAADTGDVAFRKGEAYLYGRGVPRNCDEAVKNLKAASAKSNAKARSAFGTMYATGHCVQRDLPTSYLWFALALRVDPNNQILEKDLSAVWNQMTPPERQLATRMKQ